MSAEAGVAAAEEFIAAFNDQDHERLARSLNYPHTRLALGRFVTVPSAEDFATGSARNESRLREEGWHHTVIDRIEAVHAGDDKVHLAMTVNRCREDAASTTRSRRCGSPRSWMATGEYSSARASCADDLSSQASMTRLMACSRR